MILLSEKPVAVDISWYITETQVIMCSLVASLIRSPLTLEIFNFIFIMSKIIMGPSQYMSQRI